MLKVISIIIQWVRLQFRSSQSIQAEILVLRQQLGVLRLRAPKRVRVSFWNRVIFVTLYRLCPSILDSIHIVRPETVLRWHRQGFKAYWRWKSGGRGGRPKINKKIQELIRRISRENPLWGAPLVHGELLLLGYKVAQTTVAKYMVRHPHRSGGQSWKVFLENHRDGIASMDFVTHANDRLQASLLPDNPRPRSTKDHPLYGDDDTDGRVGRAPTLGGVSLGRSAELSHPR